MILIRILSLLSLFRYCIHHSKRRISQVKQSAERVCFLGEFMPI